MLRSFVLFYFLLFVLKPTDAVDYCKDVRDCGGTSNIVCRRDNKCEPTDNCQEIKIHKDVKNFILDRINGIRNSVALGQGPLKGKTAGDMRALSWHEELEYIAQCAINVCENRLKQACPVAAKFNNPHLIYTNRLDVLFDDDFNYFNETIKTWNSYGNGMNGLADFNGNHYDYAAMIVAKSTAIGCAWSRVIAPIYYHNYNGHFFFAACLFGQMPTGNVFEEGAPCSKCPKGTRCNSQFKALCGEVTYAVADSSADYDYDNGSSQRRASLVLISVILLLVLYFILL